MKFVHLQCQTAYSLLKSTCTIDMLVQRAKHLGMEALAITDENVMYGVIPFYKACKREGIKPIIGLTATILEETAAYPLILLAENEVGYHNLLKISSSIMTKAKNGIPRKWLSHYVNGVIGISPGSKGEIEQFVLLKDEEKARAAIRKNKLMFSKFYISIQNHNIPEEEWLNQRLLALSKEEGVHVVATNDIRYIEKQDSIVHECLLSIENGTKLADKDRPHLLTDEYELKSQEEMTNRFSSIPQAISNTVVIAEECHVEISFHQSRLPAFPVPAGETSEVYLERICKEGLQKRYKIITDVHKERLRHELRIISKMGFSDYFLIVWDFMKYAHSHEIVTGPGRGSAAGSLVAYVLEITDIDPIAYDLLFERFLNPERVTLPDIDIDFPDVRRDEMIQYVSNKYGKMHVAQIVTFGTLAARAAIRDIARVHGLSPKEIDYFAKLIPSRVGNSLENAYRESEMLRNHIHSKPLFEQIYEIARKVEGLPRHTSVHAAGIIMSNSPLVENVAIQDSHLVYLTQYPAEVLEELGLLKMDFLGLRNLTILDTIRKLIKESEGITIDFHQIPLQDERTYALLSRGDTTGVFQLESAGMRRVLRMLKPTEFEDIVAVNALYRPGPMEQIPIFIESKHGKRSIQYLHKDLQPILGRTYGVIVYQEQIMQIASVMAGFSLGEADLLRRAVSKKKRDILDEERVHFVTGCLKKGHEEHTAQAVYDLIVRFANYGFNRSHAVAYSMIAYQLAYLKANYPHAFMTALLSSAIGNEEKIIQYSREAIRRDITILPPSILKSGFRFQIEGDCIRYSLLAIRNIGVATVKEIIEERYKRPYSDFFDFCIRLSNRIVTRKVLETLICSGCFDDFYIDRASLLASIETALEYAELVKPNDVNQMDMFLDEELVPKPQYVQVESMPFMEKLKLEKEMLGFYLSSYPTFVYKELQEKVKIPTLAEALYSNQSRIRMIVYISKVKIIRTKKLQKMAFLTICDKEEEMEAVMFPDTYLRFSPFVKEEQVMLLVGSLSIRKNQKQWVIEGLYPLDSFENYKNNEYSVYIKLPSEHERTLVTQIMETIYHNPGFSHTYMYYEKEHKMVQLSYIFSVHPNKECLQSLRDIVGQENVVCKI